VSGCWAQGSPAPPQSTIVELLSHLTSPQGPGASEHRQRAGDQCGTSFAAETSRPFPGLILERKDAHLSSRLQDTWNADLLAWACQLPSLVPSQGSEVTDISIPRMRGSCKSTAKGSPQQLLGGGWGEGGLSQMVHK
jgi:hypothetical protein